MSSQKILYMYEYSISCVFSYLDVHLCVYIMYTKYKNEHRSYKCTCIHAYVCTDMCLFSLDDRQSKTCETRQALPVLRSRRDLQPMKPVNFSQVLLKLIVFTCFYCSWTLNCTVLTSFTCSCDSFSKSFVKLVSTTCTPQLHVKLHVKLVYNDFPNHVVSCLLHNCTPNHLPQGGAPHLSGLWWSPTFVTKHSVTVNQRLVYKPCSFVYQTNGDHRLNWYTKH